MLSSGLIVFASYAIGAVPVAYLAGRLLKGIDIREHGSGNVGASNVWRTVSKPAVVPVGLAEIAQGMLGILIAKLAGESLGVQVVAGLAAIAGHNWSPFLGFTGGRGIDHAIGFMLILSWPALGTLVGASVVGIALRAMPQLVGLGIIAAPLAALAAGQSAEIVGGTAGMAALIVGKRLLTNHPSSPPGADIRAVLLNRLLYDRDTREREVWVER
ncbi:MAG: glycerol-3-phosphate acyltransferase [Dehalococcoidia bacterium]